MKVALCSWGDIATGLGSEARWLWKLLPFDRWVVAKHSILGWGRQEFSPVLDPDERSVVKSDHPAAYAGIDVVVCLERPAPEHRHGIPDGVKLVVLANPEYASPRSSWWSRADVIVARTFQAMRALEVFQPRHLVHCPAVMDLDEFPYTEREVVRTVRYCNGWGGLDHRRGWPEVRQMLELGACIQVWSQRDIPGTEHRGAVESSRELYEGADLVLCPSRFEGLGLVAREAMASGALVMATAQQPLYDLVVGAYRALAAPFLLPAGASEPVATSAYPEGWPTFRVDPVAAVDRISTVRGMDARELSRRGREYIEHEHGPTAAKRLWKIITEAGA